MNMGEIMSDALAYPLNNFKALVLYIVLGIIAAIIGGTSIISLLAATSTKGLSGSALSGVGIIGTIIFIMVLFLIEGYALEIVKFGIQRRTDSPGINFGRQIPNALKLIIVDIAYYIVPAIILFILGIFFKDWFLTMIIVILAIIFSLANLMARCRLAKTDSLGEALSMGEAIGDISRVGFFKLVATVILIIIISVIIILVIGFINEINGIIGNILLGIAMVYLVFFYHRAIGLLYSDA